MQLNAKNLSFAYPEHPVLKGVSLTAMSGQITMILGANGSGKSTLLKILSGWLKNSSGQVLLDDLDLTSLTNRERAAKLAVVSQEPLTNLSLTVNELLLFGRTATLPRWGNPGKADILAVQNSLELLQLSAFADRSLAELSGGERQVAALGAALALQAPVLLLDEPTSALDPARRRQVMRVLKALFWHPAIVLITHDPNLALQYADCVYGLKNGEIQFGGSVENVLTSAGLTALYDTQSTLLPGQNPGIVFAP